MSDELLPIGRREVQRHDETIPENEQAGVIAELGELGPNTVITEEGVARLFGRHPTSVKRAVERGELPSPIRLFAQNIWTVRVLVQHLEDRLRQAADAAEHERGLAIEKEVKKGRKMLELAP